MLFVVTKKVGASDTECAPFFIKSDVVGYATYADQMNEFGSSIFYQQYTGNVDFTAGVGAYTFSINDTTGIKVNQGVLLKKDTTPSGDYSYGFVSNVVDNTSIQISVDPLTNPALTGNRMSIVNLDNWFGAQNNIWIIIGGSMFNLDYAFEMAKSDHQIAIGSGTYTPNNTITITDTLEFYTVDENGDIEEQLDNYAIIDLDANSLQYLFVSSGIINIGNIIVKLYDDVSNPTAIVQQNATNIKTNLSSVKVFADNRTNSYVSYGSSSTFDIGIITNCIIDTLYSLCYSDFSEPTMECYNSTVNVNYIYDGPSYGGGDEFVLSGNVIFCDQLTSLNARLELSRASFVNNNLIIGLTGSSTFITTIRSTIALTLSGNVFVNFAKIVSATSSTGLEDILVNNRFIDVVDIGDAENIIFWNNVEIVDPFTNYDNTNESTLLSGDYSLNSDSDDFNKLYDQGRILAGASGPKVKESSLGTIVNLTGKGGLAG